jgi:hypothetical protein
MSSEPQPPDPNANPYASVENSAVSSVPFEFVGRADALAHLHQYLIDPQQQTALVFTGQQHSGKSALLWAFQGLCASDASQTGMYAGTYFPVYLALIPAMLSDEGAWLLTLYEAIYTAMLSGGFSAERLPPPAPDAQTRDQPAAIRAWLLGTALPRLHQLLRGGRRLVLLLDDAQEWLHAIDSGALPSDTPAFLHALLHPRLAMILTFDTAAETELHRLSPLVHPANTHRLHFLTADALAALYPGPDAEIVEQVAAKIHRLTGGHPALAQHAGGLLWERTGSRMISLSDVQAVTAALYTESGRYYRALWGTLTLNERLTLTAVAGLLYRSPLTAVTPEQIEVWLVETDYRLDLTAIHAAIRSLEYREILAHQIGDMVGVGIVIAAELLQKWLLENARLEANTKPLASASTLSDTPFAPLSSPGQHRALWLAIALAVLLFVMVMLALALNSPPITPDVNPIPTVTLAADVDEAP